MDTIFLWDENLFEQLDNIKNDFESINKKKLDILGQINDETFYDYRDCDIEEAISAIKDDYSDLEEDVLPWEVPDIDPIKIICKDNKKYQLVFEYETIKYKMDMWPDIYRIEWISEINYEEIPNKS